MSHDDFAFEPVPGLPKALPKGEQMLWQCAPGWRSLAWRGMYVRPVAFYFAAIMLWRFGEAMSGGGSVVAGAFYAAELLPAAVLAIAVLVGLAWIYAKSTLYTLTNKRVVIRSGVAMPMTVNIPYRLIDGASLSLRADGSGDLPLSIRPSAKVYSLALWPHLRPWNFGRPQPMLRGVAKAERVAGILTAALEASMAEEAGATEGAAVAKASPQVRVAASRTERPAVASARLPAHENLQGAMS